MHLQFCSDRESCFDTFVGDLSDVIIEWIVDEAKEKHKGSESNTVQFISMGLLFAHFVVAMYIMLVPKLAHSQNGSNSKGVFLLTVALIDWFTIPIVLLSLVENGGISDAECGDKGNAAAYVAVVLFFMRIAAQAFVFVWNRHAATF